MVYCCPPPCDPPVGEPLVGEPLVGDPVDPPAPVPSSLPFPDSVENVVGAPVYLPFPDLPFGKVLTLTHLDNLLTIPHLGLDYNTEDIDGHKPIDFGKLTAAEWLSVAKNMNLFSGLYFDNVKKASSIPVLLPKNKSLFPIFQHSQTSAMYNSTVSFKSDTADRSAISSVGATANVSTPWVSASASYNNENEDREVEKSEELSTTVQYELPIGKFNFSAGLDSYIDFEDNTNPAALFQVNPVLVTRFTALLDDFDEVKKGTKGVDKFDLIKDVGKFFHDFGDVCALSVNIGLASYKTATVSASTQQSLRKYKESWEGAINGSFSGGSGGASGSYDEAKSYGRAGVKKMESSEWKVVAGSVPVDPNNPFTLVDNRQNPNSWSATEYSDYIAIVDLLPPNLQNRMKEYDDDIEYMSIFHNLDDNRLFQFEDGWNKNTPVLVKSVASQTSISNIDMVRYGDRDFLSIWLSDYKHQPFEFIRFGDGQYTIHTTHFNQVEYINWHLHSGSVGKLFNFINDNITPITSPPSKNVLFFIVPYRPTKGSDPSEMRYAIRNVATRDYMYARSAPIRDGIADRYWALI